MNEDLETNDIDEIMIEPSPSQAASLSEAEAESTPLAPVTKNDVQSVVQELLADQKPAEDATENFLKKLDPLAGYHPQLAEDIRQALAQHTRELDAEYAPLITANLANIAVERVASGYSPATKSYIRDMVAKMDRHTAKQMIDDPKGLEVLEHIAFGVEAKADRTKIPRTTDPIGYGDFDASEGAHMKAFMTAFGIDRKRAAELYRQAQQDSK